ncbi:MAG: hypothetical protein ABI890_01855 [Lapillicoccus sp.]
MALPAVPDGAAGELDDVVADGVVDGEEELDTEDEDDVEAAGDDPPHPESATAQPTTNSVESTRAGRRQRTVVDTIAPSAKYQRVMPKP